MKLFSTLFGFNLPAAQGIPNSLRDVPKSPHKIEHRGVDDVLSRPVMPFVDPNSLHFPDHNLPVVPGNPNVTCGVGMIAYDHQPQWDRSAVYQTGPIKDFFRRVIFDNRIKHV